MNFSIPVSAFKAKVESYERFALRYDTPLSPVGFSIPFDQIAVCLSASPYISLRGEAKNLCLKHIVSVRESENAKESALFLITCKVYLPSGKCEQTTFSLTCCKNS